MFDKINTLFNKDHVIKGSTIDSLKLIDWWSVLAEEERVYIISLIGDIHKNQYKKRYSDENGSRYLHDLTYKLDFKGSKDFILIEKTLIESERLCKSAVDLHFVYERMLDFYYRNRKNEENLEKYELICLKDINNLEKMGFLPPVITSILRISALLESKGKIKELIEVCDILIKLNRPGWDHYKVELVKKYNLTE